MIIIVHTEAQAYGNEGRIAAVLHTLHKCLCAMSGDLMAADPAVIHDDKSRTGKCALRCDYSGLQSRSGGDDLEGGTRFVGIVDAAVASHGIQLLLLLFRSQGGRIHHRNASVLLPLSQFRQRVRVV